MNTRQTQPYRASGSRAPSPVLNKMLAGRATPSPAGSGKALAGAMRASAKKRAKLMIPRY